MKNATVISSARGRLTGSAAQPGAILVPLALSNSSYPALAIAGNLARESNARLVLLHVVQLNIAGEERGIPRARLLGELCRSAEIRLRELAGGMGGLTAAEILVCEGRPAEAILATARRLEAGTIIVRMNRRRRWLKWLHRNTALKVARQAPCRVRLVFPGKHAETVNSMAVDPTCTHRLERLAARIPAGARGGRVLVGESGIHSRADVQRLRRAGAGAVRVGEALMRAPAGIAAKISELVGPKPQ